MTWLVTLFTGFLSLYLAFTNALADQLLEWLPVTETTSVNTDVAVTHDFKKLTSTYERGGAIPDILVKNAAFQSAALGDALINGETADPKEALVNIFCTYQTPEYMRTTTGTGWFIHPDGVIITNAHVAQTLLLADIVGDSKCVVRTGNPAEPTYTADLLYISPAWLRANADQVNNDKPRGTGERDYALLYVNSGLNNRPMPNHFPALAFDTELLKVSASGTAVTAAGYPAEALQNEGGDAKLIPMALPTTITELMTFGSNYADIFSISGSAVGGHGASGGPVVNTDGKAIGMIVTKGDDESFGNGSLRALTISYIDRTIREETGLSLQQNLTGNLPFRAKLYKDTMIPFLKQIMLWEMTE